jgi:hypothetical protein
MLAFENAKLLPKSKVFEEQVAARAKEASGHDRQKPQQAQHKNQFYTGACQSKYTAHLLDPTADRYSGEPQLASGIMGAWAAGHAVQSFLFGVKALDPVTMSATAALLLLVSAAAAFFPAMRAARVDPVETLRAE